MAPLLPFALSFAAGAMIFVVVEEVIPGSQENGNKDLASVCLNDWIYRNDDIGCGIWINAIG